MEDRDRLQLNYNACAMCRRRKLKCDRNQPHCGLCSRLGKSCTYVAIRKRSGPKRKLLQELDIRLTKIEELLKEKDSYHVVQLPSSSSLFVNQRNMPLSGHFGFPSSHSPRLENSLFGPTQHFANGKEARRASHTHFTVVPGNTSNSESNSVGLALGEQLPSQDTIRAL
ncbi:hypothetical protein N7520_000020 [Penicillium odoratum]|uniref:uncharacterized protein n=1 Tax=Penicillium odoratum TaxID=1167516 RepID=UPI0025494CF3|nr:uncharacterized protein N7520_000020 [Penicillium odoratum]KAJ5776774.1 hypothetical protein N7520_000020 [Penicillium odoratum]